MKIESCEISTNFNSYIIRELKFLLMNELVVVSILLTTKFN